MKTYTDAAGRTWRVVINVTALKRVRDVCGVDLAQAGSDGGKTISRMAEDPVVLCDVLFAVCEEQAQAGGISSEDFGRALAGDVLEQATLALLEELVDFFPSGRRSLIRTAMARGREVEEAILNRAKLRLSDPAMETFKERAFAELDQAMDRAFGTPSGDAPGSSA